MVVVLNAQDGALNTWSKKKLEELAASFYKALPVDPFVAVGDPTGRFWFQWLAAQVGLQQPDAATFADAARQGDLAFLALPEFGHPALDSYMLKFYRAAPDAVRAVFVKEQTRVKGYRWTLQAADDTTDDPVTVYYHRVFQTSNIMSVFAQAKFASRIYPTGGVIRLHRVDKYHPVHHMEALDPRYCLSTGDAHVPFLHFRNGKDGIEVVPLYWWEVVRVLDGDYPDETVYVGGARLTQPALYDLYWSIAIGSALEQVLGGMMGNGTLARLIFLFGLDRDSFDDAVKGAASDALAHGGRRRYGHDMPGVLGMFPIPPFEMDGTWFEPKISEYLLQKLPEKLNPVDIYRHVGNMAEARLQQPIGGVESSVFGAGEWTTNQIRVREAQEHGDSALAAFVSFVNEYVIEAPPGVAKPKLVPDEVATFVDAERAMIRRRDSEIAQSLMQAEIARRQHNAGDGPVQAISDDEARAIYGEAYEPGMLASYQQVDRRPQQFMLTSGDPSRRYVDIAGVVDGIRQARENSQATGSRTIALQQDIQRFRIVRSIRKARTWLALQGGGDGEEEESGPIVRPESEEQALTDEYAAALIAVLDGWKAGSNSEGAPTMQDVIRSLQELDGEPENLDPERLDAAIQVLQGAPSTREVRSLLGLLSDLEDVAETFYTRALETLYPDSADDNTIVEFRDAEVLRARAFLRTGILPRLILGGVDSNAIARERSYLYFHSGALWFYIAHLAVLAAPHGATFVFDGPDDEKCCATCKQWVGRTATRNQVLSRKVPRPGRDTLCKQGCRHIWKRLS